MLLLIGEFVYVMSDSGMDWVLMVDNFVDSE